MEKKEEQSYSLLTVATTASYVLVFILIGVPLWWKTTEVYRSHIPHNECQLLRHETVRHLIPVRLVIEDQDVQQGFFWEELLMLSSEENADFQQLSFAFHFSMSASSHQENKLVKEFTDIAALDAAFEKMSQDEKFGEITILILNKNYTKIPKFTIGCGRQGYIISDADHKNLAKDVIMFAKKIAQVERLKKIYTPASTYSGYRIPDKDRMRHLKTSKKFDITFSLIVPEPHILDVHWDIENAVKFYLTDFLKELSLIFGIKVKSQFLYMTSLPINERTSRITEDHILYPEDLPSLINPIEAKLGSETSVHPNLNLVLYIPTQSQTPLQIYRTQNDSLSSNAFLVPQWGSVAIQNCPLPENVSLPHPVTVDIQSYMEVFVTHLRLLLGIAERDDVASENLQVLPGSIIHKWELDFLLRKNAQEQLSISMSSLSSLSHLLQTIGNIVIKDEIGEKIHFAVESVEESLKFLSEGDLKGGFIKSQAAFVESEEAFFDPSLLALLYFPEDQKYAIYIPLFLPISVPVLASIGNLWKYYKHRQAKLKSE